MQLAYEPGEPLPMFVPAIGPAERKAVEQAFDVGYLGMGAATRDFESALTSRLRLPSDRIAVATSSCTAALHMAAVLAGAGPGDEVICPSFTYVAAHQAMSATGATVVFADICDDDQCLDPASVQEVITERTVAIMTCHYAGTVSQRYDEIYAIAAEHGLRVIEDAAHALGSTFADGTPVGARGDLVCFSFGQVKLITTLDGGAIVAPQTDLGPLQELRVLGIDTDLDTRYRNARFWEYDVVRQGFRYHLSTIPAALGIAQLERLDELVGNRRAYSGEFDGAFADLPQVRTLDGGYERVGPFIYTIRVPADRRTDLVAHLKNAGVPSGMHFGTGGHQFSFYAKNPAARLAVTEAACEATLTLPLWSEMPADALHRVIGGVRSFFA